LRCLFREAYLVSPELEIKKVTLFHLVADSLNLTKRKHQKKLLSFIEIRIFSSQAMVFPSGSQQPRNTYHLWRVFDYPTNSGPVRAVAIPSNWRESIVAIYSGMLSFTYIQIWVFIFAAILRRYLHTAKRTNPADPDKQEEVRRVAFHEVERFLVFYSWAIDQSVQKPEYRKNSWPFCTWIKNHLKPFTSQMPSGL
jgi:hypothetical protein